VSFKVYEGENPMAKDNHLLGSFTFTGIAPAPKGEGKIDLTFDIDVDGILRVSTTDKSNGRKQTLMIKNSASAVKPPDGVRQQGLPVVTPLSLGIWGKKGKVKDAFLRIIDRNSNIPIKKSDFFWTTYDNQTEMSFKVYEGENPMAKDNHLLGQFTFTGLTPAPEGAGIEVTFDIDADGIGCVTATEESTGRQQSLSFENSASALKSVVDIRKKSHR